MALLGAHVSTAGGLDKAIERGLALGCESIQIFTRNQMQWHAKPLTPTEIDAYRTAWTQKANRFPVLAHSSYLINLGSPEPDKLKRSQERFLDELERCEALGIAYLVVHPGSHLNQISIETCLNTIADSLNQLIRQTNGYHVKILLENTAGQGSNVGYQFEHLAEILHRLQQPARAGICLDTCHTLAAGYDIRTPKGLNALINNLNDRVGLETIRAFHLNDSKKPLGSHVDRHEHIGQGYVGIDAFKTLVNDPRFQDIPMILETPGTDTDYQTNLDCLKRLAGRPVLAPLP